MATKNKTLSALKSEKKNLSDLIRKKEKEAESTALEKMGIAYLKFLHYHEEKLSVEDKIKKANLNEDEEEIIKIKYSKIKKNTSDNKTKEREINPT